MDLETRICKGEFERMDIYMYDEKGDEICHMWGKPVEVNCYGNLISLETDCGEMSITFKDEVYDNVYESYEFNSLGNSYMVMFC